MVFKLGMRKKKKGDPKVIGSVFVLVAIALAAMWPWYMNKQFRLQNEGIPVVATIVEDKDEPGEPKLSCMRGGSKVRTCTYYAEYSYESESYSVRVENMTTRDFDFEAGDSVNLVLDPLDYAVAVEESDAQGAMTSVAIFTGAILLILTLGIYVFFKGD